MSSQSAKGRFALVGATLFDGHGMHGGDLAVVVADGRIHGVVPTGAVEPGLTTHELTDLIIAPGFIDAQVNGGGGVLFNDDPTPQALSTIARAHRRFGTTNWLPTFMTGPRDGMARAAAAVEAAIRTGHDGVLGIHFEGPFIAKARAGIHDPRFIRAVEDADLAVIRSLGGKGVTLVTLAPEVVPAAIIADLTGRGILVSLGHTDADLANAANAFAAGAKGVTHLFNAMSPLGSRAPGVVGAALADEGAYVGIIADGVHVDFTTLKVALKAKETDKAFLVTDAMSPVGSDQSDFMLGPHRIKVEGGRLVNDQGVLAGSNLDMASAVRNCVTGLGLPLEQALAMASTTVAAFLGLGDELGRVRPGYRANLTILDADINVAAVVVEGHFLAFR